MTKVQHTDDRTASRMRKTARIIMYLVLGFCFLSLIAHVIGDIFKGNGPEFNEGTVIAGFIIIITLGFVLARRREGLGGLVIVLAAVFFGLFNYIVAGHNKGWVLLFTSLPFLVPGLLFLLCWRKGRHSKPEFNE